MLRIAMIGIAGVLLALQVKALKPEYGIYLCLAVSLLVFLQMTDLLGMILAGLQTVQESLPLQAGYFKILLKIIGITYIAELLRICVRMPGMPLSPGRSRCLASCQCWRQEFRC